MEFALGLLTVLAAMSACLAQQRPQPAPQGAPQGPSAPLLGVRYSAATDVSHVSFNSPLVSYGSSLNEIQLPAAPIQPANLKQAPQTDGAPAAGNEQAFVRSLDNQGGQAPQLQSPTPASQPQFLSVQQYPANPPLQSSPQSFSLSQNLPAAQQQNAPNNAPQYPTVQQQQQQFPLVQTRQQPAAPQPPQQYVLPQQYAAPQQQQYLAPQQQQQYLGPQQYLAAQQQQQQQYPAPPTYSPVSSDAYFATGPYAAQYAQPNVIARQYEAQAVLPQYPQPVAAQYPQPAVPAAQLVSRVAFNGPVGGFTYSF